MIIKKILLGLALSSILFSVNAQACPKNKCVESCIVKRTNMASKVIKAVSKTGLSAVQTRKIAEGLAEYEDTMLKIKNMAVFPVDSFINEEFDDKRFIKEMSEKYVAKIAANAALFKYVFAVLDIEQRKIFKREYAAPLISKMIKSY